MHMPGESRNQQTAVTPALLDALTAIAVRASSAILSIAHRLSLDAVAEGIESEQQLAFLTKHGCQFGQGYYFSRPVDAPAIATLMAHCGAQTARHRRVERQLIAATAG